MCPKFFYMSHTKKNENNNNSSGFLWGRRKGGEFKFFINALSVALF